MDLFSEFVRVRTYARWREEDKRRETWEETVDRYCNFIFNETLNCDKIPEKTKYKIKKYILNKEDMPSMRLLASAGESCRRDNSAAYNCSAMAMHSLECFGEAMLLLLNGAGVGYSVESKYTTQLPEIRKQKNLPVLKFIVPDTKLGWKQAVDYGIKEWFDGRDVVFDLSQIRPAGTPLIVSGGYASGPEPLSRCLEFLRSTIIDAQGRQLRPIEVSDMMCEIGASVVSGGVRRTAMICLCDVEDEELRLSKQGSFHPRRFMANISAVYHKKPNVLDFTQEFVDMAKSGSGERGIFNLYAARKRAPKRRDRKKLVITNPCAETILRDMGFCNLTEVVVRPTDDFDSVLDKIKTATWIGCIQSTLTHFPHLRPEWQKNAEEERLIGVSMTGMCDNIELFTPENMKHFKNKVIKTAKMASEILGINMPAATSLCKPSGTVSSLVNAASGIHSRWAPFYIRRVRISTHDALFKMMVAQGMPYEKDTGNHDTAVFSFPIKSPDHAKCRDSDTAIGQLDWYRSIVENWAEQNASATIYVNDDEWLDVTSYVYKHFDTINGVTFFPYDNKKYAQAPFEEIDEFTYYRLSSEMPEIDFSQLRYFEERDTTTCAQTLACAGNSCEI